MMETIYGRYSFTLADYDNDTLPFDKAEYSLLKFGHDDTARKYGIELATHFYQEHGDKLHGKPIMVIPSPYNYIKNAATIMTQYFFDHLNHLLVDNDQEHAEWAFIRRKMEYTKDYGFLTAEERVEISKDNQFFYDKEQFKNKILIFVDDIRITGTHEKCLDDLFGNRPEDGNTIYYLYYAKLEGEVRPEIEGGLNFSNIQTISDYIHLTKMHKTNVLIRPIKFIMGRPEQEFLDFVRNSDKTMIETIYNGCLGEGYYKVDSYKINFNYLKEYRDG